jgi:hypothetical protein
MGEPPSRSRANERGLSGPDPHGRTGRCGEGGAVDRGRPPPGRHPRRVAWLGQPQVPPPLPARCRAQPRHRSAGRLPPQRAGDDLCGHGNHHSLIITPTSRRVDVPLNTAAAPDPSREHETDTELVGASHDQLAQALCDPMRCDTSNGLAWLCCVARFRDVRECRSTVGAVRLLPVARCTWQPPVARVWRRFRVRGGLGGGSGRTRGLGSPRPGCGSSSPRASVVVGRRAGRGRASGRPWSGVGPAVVALGLGCSRAARCHAAPRSRSSMTRARAAARSATTSAGLGCLARGRGTGGARRCHAGSTHARR